MELQFAAQRCDFINLKVQTVSFGAVGISSKIVDIAVREQDDPVTPADTPERRIVQWLLASPPADRRV